MFLIFTRTETIRSYPIYFASHSIYLTYIPVLVSFAILAKVVTSLIIVITVVTRSYAPNYDGYLQRGLSSFFPI